MLPQGRFWTVPNGLSLLRIALLPLFIYALSEPDLLWLAGLLVLVGIVLDVADGWLARRLNQTSEWGRLLDPLADKLTVGVALIFCYVARSLPLWALALILGRDLLIMLVAPFSAHRLGRLPASLLVGRLAALSFALLALVYILELEHWQTPALAVAVALLLLSSLAYFRRLTSHAE